MDESVWERYGAAAGVAFVILLVLSFFIAPQPPHVDATARKIGETVQAAVPRWRA